MFLEISQNSQENTYIRVSFLIKLQAWGTDVAPQCVARQWWPCSEKYCHKGTWYTQTLLCQLLCGRNKNHFFHYFGLLHDLLHRQDLLNKWLGRKLKLLVMFPSIFEKLISSVWFYCSSFLGNFEMTLELFGYQ